MPSNARRNTELSVPQRDVENRVPVLRSVGLKRRLAIGKQNRSSRSEITHISKDAFEVQEFLDLSGVLRRTVQYRRSQGVYSQGDIAETVLYIQEGGIKMSVVNTVGKEAVVALFGTGDFFGEGCLAGQHLRNATAVTIANTTLIVIEKLEMARALHRNRELSDCFLSHMLTRNIRVEEDLVNQLLNSSKKRLARALLVLARSENKNLPRNMISTISQETLANIVGTTRSRINEFMIKFKKMGFINYDRHGIQINETRLSAVIHE